MDNQKEPIHIFLKIFRNHFLKSKIFSYLSVDRRYNYEGCSSFFLLVKRSKYQIILDKLKNNKFLYIDEDGLLEFFKDYIMNPFFEEVFSLLWKNYKDRILKINPLEILVDQKDSTEVFIYIYNNYYLKDSFNNLNNGISINPIIILYDLLNFSFKVQDFNKNKIPHFIVETLKNNDNNFILNLNNNDNNQIFKKKKLNEETSDELLFNSIYSNKSKIKDIPLFLNIDFDGIQHSTKDKLLFIKEVLNLDIIELIKKFKNEQNIFNRDDEFLVDSETAKEGSLLELYLLFVLYGNIDISICRDQMLFDDLNFQFILLFNNIQDHKFLNYNQFKNKFIESYKSIKSTDQLIQQVSLLNNNNQEELLYYFEVYLAYNYLKENQFDKVETILISNFKFISFNKTKNFNMIKSDIILLLFYYSVISCSIECFELFLKYQSEIDFYDKVVSKETFFLNTNITFEINSKEKIQTFFNYLFSDKNLEFLLDHHIDEITRTLVSNYDGETLEFILNFNQTIQSCYIDNMNDQMFQMFHHHFDSFKNSTNKQIDSKKVELFLDSLDSLNEDIQTSKGISIEDEAEILLTRFELLKKSYVDLLLLLLNSNNKETKVINQLTVLIYNQIKYFDLADIIEIYNKLSKNQESINKYFDELNEIIKFPDPSVFKNISNMFIHQLFKSIILNEDSKVSTILSIVNEKEVCLEKDFQSKMNSSEKIEKLFNLGLLKNFNFNLILEYSIDNLNAPLEFILNLIPNDNIELKEKFLIQFGQLVKLHYKEKKVEQVMVKDLESLVVAFSKGYYKPCIEFIKSQPKGFIKKPILKIIEIISHGTVGISTKWFKEFYEELLKIHLSTNSIIDLVTKCSDFQTFEFIWENHFITDKMKLLFINELIRLLNINDPTSRRFLVSNGHHPLIEYIFENKKQFLNQHLPPAAIQVFYIFTLFYGNLKMFKLFISAFPNFNFKVENGFQNLFNNIINNSYPCFIIQYLLETNQINNLKEILSKNQILNNLTLNINYKKFSCSKSTFILIHSLIIFQNSNN